MLLNTDAQLLTLYSVFHNAIAILYVWLSRFNTLITIVVACSARVDNKSKLVAGLISVRKTLTE